jgi:2-amino-4-hydroxy-6-hydroxymethyldihydropteridine diphosphokinase
VYVGLGSNLDGPSEQIRRAFDELAIMPDSRLQAKSHLYKSRPLGPQDQPDFINAVAMLTTGLGPLELLHCLRGLEERHGRRRVTEVHWGARSLDLDILVYGDIRLQTPELTIPHPRMHTRSFVLYPLAEIAPALVIPVHGPVRSLRDRCHSPPIERYEGTANE